MKPISQVLPFVELKHVYLSGISVFDKGNTLSLDCAVTQETAPLKGSSRTHGFHQ